MNQIRQLCPVSDARAARLVSEDTLAGLAAQITATPLPEPPACRPMAAPRLAAAWPRHRKAGLAAAAGLVAAAAVTASLLVPRPQHGQRPAGGPPGTGASARFRPAASAAELVAFATQAAAAGGAFDPRPHEWIYTDILQATSSAGGGGYLFGPPNQRRDERSWTRVDHRLFAYIKNGKLVVVASDLPRPARGQAAVTPVPFGWPDVSYRYLNSLPASPAKLAAVIKSNLRAEADPIGASGRGNLGVFNAVQALMTNAVLPPRLLAALYGVLARDPVVHFERSVTDLAARTGVGFATVQEGYLKEQIVIDPRTYAYMGYVDVAVRAHTSAGLDGTAHFRKGQVLGWEALLASGIVRRPGQLP